MGTILAVDYGTARVGLAVSDAEQRWAFGRGTAHVTSDQEAIQAISTLARDEGVERIVVGLPLSLENREQSAMAKKVQAFCTELEEVTRIPVEVEDERLTSSAATRLKRETHGTTSRSIDEQSAILILEDYLTRQHRPV